MNITIWHNPICTKSRQALDLLRAKGIEPTIREYIKDAPSLAELQALHAKIGGNVIDFTRVSESVFKDLGLSDASDNETLLDAMVQHPKLIERPIVITDDSAVLGRPTEAILKLL